MKQNELIPNNWYYWNDPDNGLTSQPVKYLEYGMEPGVVDVASETGAVFSVLVDELTESTGEGTMPLYSKDLSKLVFSPMYWFKSVYNIRISELGFVLVDVSDRDPLDLLSYKSTTAMFDIKSVSRLEFIKRRYVQGATEGNFNPAEDTIFIEYAGGTLYLKPGTNVAEHLYNVLNQLRLYFTGFLVSLEDLDVSLVAAKPPAKTPVEHLETVLAETIRDNSSYPSSVNQTDVANYVNQVVGKLNALCPKWTGEVNMGDSGSIYYAKFSHHNDLGTMFFDLRSPSAKSTFLRLEEMVANERRG